MNRTNFYLIALALVSVLAAGCGGYSSPSPAMAPPTSPTPPTPGSPTSDVSVQPGASLLTTTAYAPNPANVAVGTTVIWTNGDSTQHTTTSDGNLWNSGSVNPRGQFSFTFTTAGTFRYHCAIHPNMVGTVVVQ